MNGDDQTKDADPAGQTVRTGDIETYYRRCGDGPPIVFIHGMAMSTTQWEPQLGALSDEYTAIAYDVRGHGHTGGSDRDPYTIDRYAADLDALLTALAIKRPVLCGLSMGGCIAQVYAATHPEEVAGLVLSDTFTAGPLPIGGRLLFANLRGMGRMDRVIRYTTLNRLQTRIADRLTPGIAGDIETIQQLMESAPTIPHREFRKIADSVAAFPKQELDYSRITCPTLVMHGENVPAILRTMHTRLAEQLTNAPVMMRPVPDAGHASNVDNPTFFTAEVRRFADVVFVR
ncbi:MAG: alpha/beta hydrolase [Halobacteriales archaeon]|nr:alpha/beta hydrolase [Halobacteriales archaeon]